MRFVREMRRRFDVKSRGHGLAYPWWVALFSHVLQITLVVAATAQRTGEGPLALLVLGAGLVLLPQLVQLSIRAWVPWYLQAGGVLVGCGVLFAAAPPPGFDLVPPVLAVVAADLTASEGLRRGVVYAVLAAGIALVDDPAQSQPGVGEIAIGFMVGAMLWWQSRSLLAERRARRREGDAAAAAERQRIARDVHDLLAHSLSVTLLQVAGARRALRDHELEEADHALEDAETAARTAMDDIRRTVGLLADQPGPSHPLPDAADLPTLVDHVTSAGLDVDLTITGDLGALPPTVGLTVYRVAQEALTNAVRHGAGAPATVVAQVSSREVRLVVANALPTARSRASGRTGHGLRGMAERADQVGGRVRTGPRDSRWVVELTVPLGRQVLAPTSRPSTVTT